MKKFEMLNIICKDCDLTAKEKLVAQYFVYKSNKLGSCYPCVATIAEECGVSRRTVQRATKKLEEREYILIEERFKFGKQASNLYTFNTLLLTERQRVKEEREQESIQQEKADSIVMEVIEFEELLRNANAEIANEVYQEEVEDGEGIDLDELIESGYQEDVYTEEVWEEVPFQEQENVVEKTTISEATKCVQQEQARKNSFFSIMLCISILLGQDIGAGTKKIEVMYLLIVVNCNFRASRKIMGAFFPP